MEIMSVNDKVLNIFESVTKQTGLSSSMKIKEVVQDSLSLMKIIVQIETEFNIFLDDIDFIALYNLDIQGFIQYAKIK